MWLANICYCHKFMVGPIVNLMHFCVMFVMRSSTQPKMIAAQKCTYNFATTTFVLLPGLELGSKSLLPPKKMNF